MSCFGHALRAATVIAMLAPASASAQAAKVGVLQCQMSGAVGMTITENQALDCVYKSEAGGPLSHYIGRLTNVGANIGITGPGRLVWAVVAATNDIGSGALAGDYVGAPGSVAVGPGVGGAVLSGGSNNTISLQPISLSVSTGRNVSAGHGNVNLQHMPVADPRVEAGRVGTGNIAGIAVADPRVEAGRIGTGNIAGIGNVNLQYMPMTPPPPFAGAPRRGRKG